MGDGAQPGVEMGPLVTGDHCKRVEGYIEKGVAEGADAAGGRPRAQGASGGFFLGPTIFDHVTPEMTIAREEIFGPVLSVIRVKTLDDAIDLVNSSPFGNATAIFTASGKSAREYSSRMRSRHGGSQRRRRRAHGVLPVRRLEELLLRRPARARQGRRRASTPSRR